jgi:hypothetical protein
MAARDIMPFTAATARPALSFRMGALTTDSTEDTSWNIGEVLILDAAVGDINEHPDGTLAPDGGLAYLAAAGSAELIALAGATSGAATHAIEVPCWDVTGGEEFVCTNVYSGDDTELALTVAAGVIPGITADFWTDDSAAAHKHGLNIAGDYFVITRMLDADNRNFLISGAACVKVVFKRAA